MGRVSKQVGGNRVVEQCCIGAGCIVVVTSVLQVFCTHTKENGHVWKYTNVT